MWEKIKAFLKKYGGYIVAFVLGALAYIGIDARRDRRVDANLQQLKNQLAGYKQLNQQFADRIKELEARLAQLADTSETAYQQHQQLADGIRQAGIDVAIVAERVDSAITHADAVEHVTDELQQNQKGLETSLHSLENSLKKYGAKTEIH